MHFEKVSETEWNKTFAIIVHNKDYDSLSDNSKAYCRDCYNNIQLPRRSTKGSAGYDFFVPFNILTIDDTPVVIPTGIRWIGDDNQVLLLVPRSGLGFKYGARLSNTIGVIDNDYSNSDNEGHIMCKIVSDTTATLNRNEKFIQGIVVQYATTDDDNVTYSRNGGFGSTDHVNSDTGVVLPPKENE